MAVNFLVMAVGLDLMLGQLTIQSEEFIIMTTVTLTRSGLLQNALRGNALFSGIGGMLAILEAALLSDFMAAGSAIIYIILGASLVLYAGLLFFTTIRQPIDMRVAWFAVIADGIWVVGSAVILLSNVFELSDGGKWLLLILADIVLVFAIAQYIGIRRIRKAG